MNKTTRIETVAIAKGTMISGRKPMEEVRKLTYCGIFAIRFVKDVNVEITSLTSETIVSAKLESN